MRMKCSCRLAISLVLLSVFVFGGCGKSETSKNIGKSETETARSLESLSAEDILIQVGSLSLTKGEYDNRLKFREAFAKMVNPSPKVEEKKKIEENLSSGVIISFIQESYVQNSLERYIATNGPLPEATAETAKREIRLLYEEEDVNGRSRNLDEIEKTLDAAGVGDIFRGNLKREILTEQFLQSYRPDFMIVDGITVTNFMMRHTVMNAVAEVTNTTILAVANEVRRRAAADEDFAALAEKYSMDPERAPGGDLGDCIAADFGGEEEIFDKIKKMSAGGVTEVIDADDSWRIYKVIAKTPAAKSVYGTDTYHLARIYFRKAVVYPPFTEGEIVHELYRSRRKKVSQMILDEAMRRDAVTFPNGWKLFPGDNVRKFMANIEEKVRPGGENPYINPQGRAMRAMGKGGPNQPRNIMNRKTPSLPNGKSK